MSASGEPSVRDRVGETPAFSVAAVREVKPRELGIRFAAGAVTSIVAGVVSLLLGLRVGGVLLAFPAILAASLTLIYEDDDAEQAREDARGAMLGGAALIAFAVVAAVALQGLSGALALALAAIAWLGVAIGGYFMVWR